ncbi:MAG: hypothetical protein V5A57_02085 [Candidatus Paceibacterota bacterium]
MEEEKNNEGEKAEAKKKQESKEKSSGKSSTGLDENVAAFLSYLLGLITGVLFFVVEKKSEFVKFHAMQSLITFGIVWIISLVLAPLSLIIGPLSLLLWVFLMYKAYKGEKYKIPGIGDFAEKQAKDLK